MILDTNAVSALLAGDVAIEKVLSVAERHELSTIVIGEYRYGLRGSRHRRALEPLFDQLIQESQVLSIDRSTADTYALVRWQLRKQGTPLPENDVWIAAQAIQHGLPIVSRDEHFDQIKTLERISW